MGVACGPRRHLQERGGWARSLCPGAPDRLGQGTGPRSGRRRSGRAVSLLRSTALMGDLAWPVRQTARWVRDGVLPVLMPGPHSNPHFLYPEPTLSPKGVWLSCPLRPPWASLYSPCPSCTPHAAGAGDHLLLAHLALLLKDTDACAGPQTLGSPLGPAPQVCLEGPGQAQFLGCSPAALGRAQHPLPCVPGASRCRACPGVGPEGLSSLAQRSWGPAGPGLEAVAPISALSPHFHALAGICPHCSRPVPTLPDTPRVPHSGHLSLCPRPR